jgi:hypothetical protein
VPIAPHTITSCTIAWECTLQHACAPEEPFRTHAPTHALNHASEEDREQLVTVLRRLHQLKHAE